MPFRDLPRWARTALRTLLSVAYLSAGYAALAAVVWTPQTIEGALGAVLTYGWATVGLVGAAVALLGVALDRYRVEWAAVWWVAAGLSVYTLTVWALVAQTPTRQTQAAALTTLCVLLVYRAVELTAHAAKLRHRHLRENGDA